jgi:hypothetical protein
MPGKKITINNQGQFAGNVDSPRGRVHVERQDQAANTSLNQAPHEAPEKRSGRQDASRTTERGASTWVRGLFFLFAFVVLAAVLGFLAKLVPGWAVPMILVAAIVVYTLVVAAVLRLQGSAGLSEAGALDLMKAVLRLTPIIGGGKAAGDKQLHNDEGESSS